MLAHECARAAEFAKYDRAYTEPGYRMKGDRLADAKRDLAELPCRSSYLDVSCGRGDMLREAEALGFSAVQGTEIVSDLISPPRIVYAQAHELPFGDRSFAVVSLFDVIEHLLPGDDEAACKELLRVAQRHILLTANNRPSFNKAGDDLHINKRPYDIWDGLFREWFDGCTVTRLTGRKYVSEAWRIDLP
jgi:SAM-dependent methyltransferase